MSTDTATLDHFKHPQVGDRFHEMYSFWIHVTALAGDTITVEEYADSEPPKQRIFATWEDWRKAYTYESMPETPYIRWKDNLLHPDPRTINPLYFATSNRNRRSKREQQELARKVEAMQEIQGIIARLWGSLYPESEADNLAMRSAAHRLLDAFGGKEANT